MVRSPVTSSFCAALLLLMSRAAGAETLPESIPAREPMGDIGPTEADLRALEGLAPAGDGAHQKGKKPKTPEAQLPETSPLPVPREGARAAIRDRPFEQQELTLQALRKAERALFPEHPVGLEPGFSWDVPQAPGSSTWPLGLPLRAHWTTTSGEPLKGDLAWLSSLTLPDLPVRFDQRVVTYLKFYRDSPKGRTIAAIWARRSGRFVAAIQAELRRAGLPTDLVWLSLIESGHDPAVRSPAGAVGLWQFIPESARMYGLTVDQWVDERRDPARSTQAAVRFLSDLYERFESWELAMAAYNMGYAGLSRSIGKFNTNDYWMLSRLEGGIPWETTLYVPKIFALAVVMNNRQAFGLDRIKPDAPLRFDTIAVEPLTPLTAVAKAAGVPFEVFLAQNPMLIGKATPPGPAPTHVRVPLGAGGRALGQLGQGKKAARAVRLRYGESLSGLAVRYGVSEDSLLAANFLGKGSMLSAGTWLALPTEANKSPKASPPLTVAVHQRAIAGVGQSVVYYEVQPRDELEEIAGVLEVSAYDLARDNALDLRAKLREGMILQARVALDRPLDDVYVRQGDEVKVLVSGSPEFHEYFEGLRGYRRVEIAARRGDTLASIGGRFGMTVGSMERINRRARTAPLVEGEIVVVYTDRDARGLEKMSALEPLPRVEAPRPDLLPSTKFGSSL